MQNVHFITNKQGKRTAVVIDWDAFGEVHEDLYDAWLAHQTDGDALVDWKEAKRRLNAGNERSRVAAKRQRQPVKRSKPVKK
jgi:hypothetical protein